MFTKWTREGSGADLGRYTCAAGYTVQRMTSSRWRLTDSNGERLGEYPSLRAGKGAAELLAAAPADVAELIGACITYYVPDRFGRLQGVVRRAVIRHGGYMLEVVRHIDGETVDCITPGEVGDVLEYATPQPAKVRPAEEVEAVAIMAEAQTAGMVEAAERAAAEAEQADPVAPGVGTLNGQPMRTYLADPAAVVDVVESTAEARTGSAVVAALETAWRAVQRRHLDLPDVVVIIGSGASSSTWGHAWPERWVERKLTGGDAKVTGESVDVGDPRGSALRLRAELFISGERLACGGRLTLQTLIHEAAHVLAHVRGVKDTSRQGRYHNRRFVDLATSLGLRWPAGQDPDTSIGFSAVVMPDETAGQYADVIDQLDRAIDLHLPLPPHMGGDLDPAALAALAKMTPAPTAGTSRNLPVAVCGCEEPRKMRMSPGTLALGPVICGVCREEFAVE